MDAVAGVSKMERPPTLQKKQEKLSFETSLLMALSSVTFDHKDPKTSRHLTSCMGIS
jgi:hypothetical protein